MSRIFLVRHGQASFGRDNYDELSDLGWTQAGTCGEALRRQGVLPESIVTGTLQRQRATAEAMIDGSDWPSDLTVDARWNELDPDALMAAYHPDLADKAALKAELAKHDDPRRVFQAMYTEACQRWVSGDHDDYAESFAAFQQRVGGALSDVAARLGKGEDAVVVTSGGPISLVVAGLLTHEPSADAMELVVGQRAGSGSPAAQTWLNLTKIVVNAGVSTVIVGRNLTLLDFNNHAHLASETGLATFR